MEEPQEAVAWEGLCLLTNQDSDSHFDAFELVTFGEILIPLHFGFLLGKMGMMRPHPFGMSGGEGERAGMGMVVSRVLCWGGDRCQGC